MSRLSRAGSAGAVGPRAVFHDQGWLADYWIVLNCSSIILQVATEIDCETEYILFNLCSLVLVCISAACLVRSLPVLLSFHPCVYLPVFAFDSSVCVCVCRALCTMLGRCVTGDWCRRQYPKHLFALPGLVTFNRWSFWHGVCLE